MRSTKRTICRRVTSFLLIVVLFACMTPYMCNQANASPQGGLRVNLTYDLGKGGEINGKSIVKTSLEITESTMIKNVTKTNTGYHFLGWTTEKDSGRVDYKPGEIKSFSEDTTLWAVWQINFIIDLGDGVFAGTNNHAKTYSVISGSQVTIPSETPKNSKAYLYFDGYHDAQLRLYYPGEVVIVTEPLYLTASWMQSCKLTYDANGGKLGAYSEPQTFRPGERFALSNLISITRPGYEFLGYATQKGATEATYQKGQEVVFYGDTKLFALWKGTITYDLNGGELSSGSRTQDFALDSRVTIKTPVLKARSGYYLVGWEVVGDSTKNKLYKRGDTEVFADDTVLRAVWVKNTAVRLSENPVRLERADTFVRYIASDGARMFGADQTDFSDFPTNDGTFLDLYYNQSLAELIQRGGGCGVFAAFNYAAYLLGDNTYTHEEVKRILYGFCQKGASVLDGWEMLIEYWDTGDSEPGAPWSVVRELSAYMLNTNKRIDGFWDDVLDKINTGLGSLSYETVGLANRLDSEQYILSMLENDIPVIMSHSGNTGNHPKQYYSTQLVNGDVYLDSVDSVIDDHYFNIVGAYCDSNGRIKWLEISTWGGRCFLSWEEVWKDGCGQYSPWDARGFGNAIMLVE